VQEIRRQNLGIDAIVTTSPPISSHLIGREAKDILGCPWIADLRDLWTQNLGERTSNLLQIGLEKRTLRQADGLVTVSDPWATRLERRYPEKKIWTITNGFDPDDFDSPPPPLTEEFSISYTGELYAGQRDPTLLLEVLSDLIHCRDQRPDPASGSCRASTGVANSAVAALEQSQRDRAPFGKVV